MMATRKKTTASQRGKVGTKSAEAVPMPSWRRIEALRERRALLSELADIGQESPDLGEDIFFHDDEELRRLYQPAAKIKKEDFEVDEDALVDEDDDVG
jgi:hypothetical protein